jgi:arylsulfatase A-like enzyme
MRHLYARSISYMDAWLGRVLKTLARRGILEDTLVIITADHGESFGEDGLIAHGFGLTEPLIHVPLIMAGPGAAATDRAFSLAELPGLIARAAGVSDHAVARREHPPGIAVAQYDAIGPPDHPRIIEFAQRWELDSAAVARLTTSFSVATDGARKLVQTADGEHRYDLIADPAAARPLEQSTYDSFSDLRSALERCDTAVPELATRPPAAISEAERLELERQMKLLGYM